MTVKISELTFKSILGILPKERVKKQKIIVDISFEYKFKDGVFIDYSVVANEVKNKMQKEKFKLIEDAILSIEKMLMKKHSMKNLQIKITKPTILKNSIVSVSL